MPEGQHDPMHGYRDYTQGMVAALEPFSRHGTLYRKVRDPGPRRLFALEDLGRTDQPVTIILAAREQDLEKAETVLALAVKKLQQFLFGRFEKAEKDVRPVLLLLDETRRIRAFDANKYITFAREAKAGCVSSTNRSTRLATKRRSPRSLRTSAPRSTSAPWSATRPATS